MSAIGVIGIILLIVSVIAYWISRSQKLRSFSIKSARAASINDLHQLAQDIAKEIGAGNWQDYVRLWGEVRSDQPLQSPLNQTPCVYYTMTVTQEYEETVTEKDDDGNTKQTTRRSSETVSRNQQSIPFQLHDDSGIITVDPDQADIETVKILDEFRPDNDVAGKISFGSFSFSIGHSISTPRRRILGYRFTESILPVNREALIVGMVTDSTGKLAIRKPLDDKKYIITLKPYEVLTKAADNNAKTAFYVAIATAILGAIFLLIGILP
ncbi:MAG: E3 ubiquitin ligase family protein [Thainema sp.]